MIRKGYSEWDIEQMIKLAYSVLSDLADESNQMDINAIGVTGQMHGMVLLDQDNVSCSPFIGWQDQRCNQFFCDEVTYLEAIQEIGQDYLEKTINDGDSTCCTNTLVCCTRCSS